MSDAPWRRWFPGPGHTRRYWTACILLTLFAAALRFNGLGASGLSHDEFVETLSARGNIREIIEETRHVNSAPILYPLILAGVQKIDISSVSIRFIPALSGTLTVAALALLIPASGIRRTTAFLAATLASVSAPAIQLAQDAAHPYTLDTLLIVIILASGLLYLRGRGKYLFFPALFIAPILHYGIPLFCVAILITLFVKRWLDLRLGTGGRKALGSAVVFTLWPALFLVAGGTLTYYITLSYHGTGFESDGILESWYYQGDPSNIAAILEFSGDHIFRMIDYHTNNLAFVLLAMTIIAIVTRRKIHGGSITVLFFFSMAVAAIAAVWGLYPLGDIHQTMAWSPVIFIVIAHSSVTITEHILQHG